nr:translation initiation factor IF-2-like [Aegilops tauschii subsp. strangulata]
MATRRLRRGFTPARPAPIRHAWPCAAPACAATRLGPIHPAAAWGSGLPLAARPSTRPLRRPCHAVAAPGRAPLHPASAPAATGRGRPWPRPPGSGLPLAARPSTRPPRRAAPQAMASVLPDQRPVPGLCAAPRPRPRPPPGRVPCRTACPSAARGALASSSATTARIRAAVPSHRQRTVVRSMAA